MASTDDLSLLMPSLQRQAVAAAGDTPAVREWEGLQAGGATEHATLPGPPRAGRQALNGRLRSNRQPQRHSIAIQWKPVVLGRAGGAPPCVLAEQPPAEQQPSEEDAEQQMALLLEGVLRESRGIAYGRMRTQRLPPNREVGIKLKAVVLPAPEPSSHSSEQENEQAAFPAEPEPQTARKPSPQLQPARTPGTALRNMTPMEGVPEWFSARRPARVPGTAAKGTATPYTPIEGVPERLGPARPATAKAAPTPYTPMEGVPERQGLLLPSRLQRVAAAQHLPRVRVAGVGAVQQEEGQSVDSPVGGLVQQEGVEGGVVRQAARSSSSGAQQAEQGGSSWAGFPAADNPAESSGALDDGGFDYGGNDEPSVCKDLAAGVDAAVQTGLSLRSRAMPAAEPGPDLQQQLEEAGGMQDGGGMDYGDDYDYDAGGFDDYDDYDDNEGAAAPEPNEAAEHDAAEEPQPGVQHAAHKRRQTLNPGARLRNELGKRKSLGADPSLGRREIAPGLRRSSRHSEPPLQYWLGEKKQYTRKHKTMPTVEGMVHKSPTTPYRMVADIYRQRHGKRQRQQGEQE